MKTTGLSKTTVKSDFSKHMSHLADGQQLDHDWLVANIKSCMQMEPPDIRPGPRRQ